MSCKARGRSDEFYVTKPRLIRDTSVVRTLGAKKIKMIYSDGRTRNPRKRLPLPKSNESLRMDHVRCFNAGGLRDKNRKPLQQKAGQLSYGYGNGQKTVSMANCILYRRVLKLWFHNSAAWCWSNTHSNRAKAIVTGHAVGSKIATGNARIIHKVEQLHEFKAGDVLVADMTTPDWEPVMKIASAIVTNRGGRTCHAAIISRELGVPAVVGCK